MRVLLLRQQVNCWFIAVGGQRVEDPGLVCLGYAVKAQVEYALGRDDDTVWTDIRDTYDAEAAIGVAYPHVVVLGGIVWHRRRQGAVHVSMQANDVNTERPSHVWTQRAFQHDVLEVVAHDRRRIHLEGEPLANLDVANISTCLLYTSPSPRDLSTSRMPSSA